MHKVARHAAIMKLMAQEGACTVAQLMTDLGVSDETIRRDIKELARGGRLQRVHGGAVMPNYMPELGFGKRMQQNAEAKSRIAATVAAEIADGDSIIMDTGSTTAYAARALTRHSRLLIVVNSGEIGRILTEGKGNQVFVAGGELRADDGAQFGPTATEFVRQFRARYAIISIGGANLEEGLMDFDIREAQFARAVVAQANHVMVVADSSKFQTHAPIKVCGFDEIHSFVTDQRPPSAFHRRLREAGVRLLLSDGESPY
jgi:DeoR family glycerol-3-phosphate regulon repressor